MRRHMALLLLLGSLSAQAESDPAWSATLLFASDYRFRGVSQTNEDPTLQGQIEWQWSSGIYTGAFVSNVDFVPGDGATIEGNVWLGYRHAVGDFTLDGKVIHIFYPGDDADYDFTELIGIVGWRERLSLQVAWSSDAFSSGSSATYVQLAGNQPLGDLGQAFASVGYYDLDRLFGASYVDYQVGLGRSYGPLDVSLAFVNTNRRLREVFAGNDGARFVFTIATTF